MTMSIFRQIQDAYRRGVQVGKVIVVVEKKPVTSPPSTPAPASPPPEPPAAPVEEPPVKEA